MTSIRVKQPEEWGWRQTRVRSEKQEPGRSNWAITEYADRQGPWHMIVVVDPADPKTPIFVNGVDFNRARIE